MMRINGTWLTLVIIVFLNSGCKPGKQAPAISPKISDETPMLQKLTGYAFPELDSLSITAEKMISDSEMVFTAFDFVQLKAVPSKKDTSFKYIVCYNQKKEVACIRLYSIKSNQLFKTIYVIQVPEHPGMNMLLPFFGARWTAINSADFTSELFLSDSATNRLLELAWRNTSPDRSYKSITHFSLLNAQTLQPFISIRITPDERRYHYVIERPGYGKVYKPLKGKHLYEMTFLEAIKDLENIPAEENRIQTGAIDFPYGH